MHHIIYLSQAKTNLSPTELVVMLLQARDNNMRQNVTGALIYGRGKFMQLLEGEEQVVRAIYRKIVADARNYEVFKLADKAITHRSFEEWSMAFAEITPRQFDHLVGYIPPAEFEQQASTGRFLDDLLLEQMKELVRPI